MTEFAYFSVRLRPRLAKEVCVIFDSVWWLNSHEMDSTLNPTFRPGLRT